MSTDSRSGMPPEIGLIGPGFTTLRGEGYAEYEEKRSLFIGYAKSVSTETEAAEFIKSIKAKHYDARHNVSAYLLSRGDIVRYSDDGEPQGSAGLPILECIRRAGLVDTVVVVTRYFGGILLGVGGLARAYTKAAAAAIDSAGRVRYEPYAEISLHCSYSDYQRVAYELSIARAIVDNIDYAGEVEVKFALRREEAGEFCARLKNILEGRVTPLVTGYRYDFR